MSLATLDDVTVVADTTDMPRDEWLATRRQGIGGSDVSAILGLSIWSTPLQVWLDKTGLFVADDAPSEAMEWGSLLEPVVADEFSRRSGVPTVEYRALLAHAKHGHMFANVDRLCQNDPHGLVLERLALGVYEGKTTSPWSAKEWANNQVPDHAALQSHHYLTVTGLPYAYVAVLIGGQRLEWRRIEADADIARYLIDAERDFWQLVENREPPPPTERDASFLGDVWTPEPEKTIRLDDRLLELLAEREAAKEAEKQAKARAAEAQAAVALAMGDAEYGLNDDGLVVCSWKRMPEVDVKATTRAAHRRFLAHKPKTKEQA